MLLKKYLQIIYAFWSEFYDSFVDVRYKFDRNEVIQKLKIKNGEKVLEVGVGTGLNLPLYPKYCEVFGIDFSNSMLYKAKQKKSNAKITLEEMDATNIKYPDNYFDKILMTYVLRVTPQPILVLKEIIRVLKPKGKIVVVDQFKTRPSFFAKILQPIRVLLGSGKDYFLAELIKDLPLIIKNKKIIGIRKGTYLFVLECRKL